MCSKQNINLKIADKYYPLTINRTEEEDIRTAAVRINEKLQQYKTKYKSNDTTDFFAMTCLDFATELIKNNKRNDTELLLEKVKKIDLKLGNFIKVL